MRRSLLFVAFAVACVCVHQAHATCSISGRADNSKATEYVLTNDDKAAIVERHNWYKIHTPEAVDDMQLYQWDSKLEGTARVWAKKCYWGHSENSCRTNVANFSNTGENLASGYGSSYEPKANPSGMVKMTENWAGERAYYHWVGNTCDSGKVCGHYTQMIWHDSNHVGCAMMNCPADTIFSGSASWYLVCHYGKAGNWNGQAPGHIAPAGNPCSEQRLASGASRCGEFGVCVMSGGNYHCECEDGYYSPSNTGACVAGTGGPAEGGDICHPQSGADPCSGHGVCVADALTIEGYRCICSEGFDGIHCETVLNPCSPNPCAYGTCTATNTGTYTCKCQTGYTGAQCNTLVDPCSPNQCRNGGKCSKAGVSYTCNCAGTGYTGANCETQSPPPSPPTPPPAVPSKPSSAPAPAPVPAPAAPVVLPSKDDMFMYNLFDLVNADRKTNGYINATWSPSLVAKAVTSVNDCGSLYPNTAEDTIFICGYGSNLLPDYYAATLLPQWGSFVGNWWLPANIVSIGCAFTSNPKCTDSDKPSTTHNPCGSGLYKKLSCVYQTTTNEADEAFKASSGHPMLYGHAEQERTGPLAIHLGQEQAQAGRSMYTYAAIAAAGVVVAAAAVGLAVAARRRRAAAGQQVEYVELMFEDQLA